MGELHLDVYAQRIGNKHALKIYDQFTSNTSCFQLVLDRILPQLIILFFPYLEREYGVPVTMGKPKVAFRETLHTEKIEYDFWHR